MMFPAMPGLPGPGDDKPRRMNDVISPHDGVTWANLQPPSRLPIAAGARRSSTPALPISVLGLLLVVAPPAGLAAVWSHPNYDRDAKWALTVSTMMFMALATVLLVTLSR